MPILFAITMLLLQACDKDDEGNVPPVLSDLVEIETGGDKNVVAIITDDGTRWKLNHSIMTNVADSVLRCLCTYNISENGRLNVYSIKEVFSDIPHPVRKFKSTPTDPMKFISSWKSGGYLNLHLGLMTTGNGGHKYAFAADTTMQNEQGQTIAYFTLLHERNAKDAESYTEDKYFSMSLRDYADCDSLVMRINTYDGIKTVRL